MLKKIVYEKVATALGQAFPDVQDTRALVEISAPKRVEHGDYSTNIAMKLAKSLSTKPSVIAEQIEEVLTKDSFFSKVEILQPGFINLSIASEELDVLLRSDELFSPVDAHHTSVIVEYCSFNVAKHLHIGHLRNIACGEATHRIFSWMGYDVSSIDHVGDWGTQFGKIILAVLRWGDRTQIEKNPVDELNALYVRFHDELDSNPQLEDQAREVFQELEKGNEEYYALWKWIVDINQAYTNEILKDLNVTIEEHVGESFFLDKMEAVLDEMMKKDLLIENEDGSLAMDFERFGVHLPSCLIRKKDGATLYHTRDLAAVKYRLEHYQPTRLIYVVGDDQSMHFKQLFAMVRLLGWGEGVEFTHMNYGLVTLPEGKMSTRKGRAITAIEVLNEAKERATNILVEKNVQEKDVDILSLTKDIAYGAMTYSNLSISTSSNLIFDWDTILTFEGNSAPYIQYVHARTASLVAKVDTISKPVDASQMSELERALAMKIVSFRDTLEALLPDLRLNFLTQYLYELAGDFNAFYNGVRVLDSEGNEREWRLFLVLRTKEVMEKGLHLLNIAAPDRM